MKAHVRNDAGEKVKVIWELTMLIALSEEFGFGKKRLKRLYEKLIEVQTKFDRDSTCIDNRGRTSSYNDIETGLKMIIQRADRDGIDWRDILGIEVT